MDIRKEKREATIIKKYGSLENYKEQQRTLGSQGGKSRVNPHYPFKDKDFAREAQLKMAKSRKYK